MVEYIKREDAMNANRYGINTGPLAMVLVDDIASIPAADVVEVVRCKDCTLHGHCITEDHFQFARVENPYCCVGKRREP